MPQMSSPTKNSVAAIKARQALYGAKKGSGSFVLNSAVQKALYSNSNKQVHVNLIHVDESPSLPKSRRPSSSILRDYKIKQHK